MPDWVESLRGLILFIVWAVLVLRISALWRAPQRPVWIVLLVLATGSLMIQAPVGKWLDSTTGVAKAGELSVALVALTDFAAVWWFAVALHRAGHATPAWLRRAPAVSAAIMAALAVAFFVVTPAPDRFGAQAHGWWAGYAVAWITFGLVTAVGAGALFWRHGITMRSPVLRLSMLALAVGTTAELPYLVIRAIRWFTEAPPTLALVGFWCSFTRFVLVALGCSLAALEPLRRAALYWYRRQRLYGLWMLLRQATPELVVLTPRSRTADLLTFTNPWEQLHQRVIDIRDSITFLHDGWASPQLLQEAARHARGGRDEGSGGQAEGSGERAEQDNSRAEGANGQDEGEGAKGRDEGERLVAVACWIEATRRDALAGASKLHHELDKDLLPDVQASESTVHREIRHLLRLHRALRTRAVQVFADTVDHRPPAPAAP
ncbi:DUF6545 domain-containing protein [Streptomyces sichuanensis]|uniref:DUF6545 domain-containing protein n=1 Tax=Streptomyces sichuanensis TaxID=2871810 RepID=UPI0027DFA122|nr:DUF6545 domain-containing protein [Streptomyces sichuanensis]